MLIFRRSKLYFYSIWYRHSLRAAVQCTGWERTAVCSQPVHFTPGIVHQVGNKNKFKQYTNVNWENGISQEKTVKWVPITSACISLGCATTSTCCRQCHRLGWIPWCSWLFQFSRLLGLLAPVTDCPSTYVQKSLAIGRGVVRGEI
jgi:hypothetical protein